MRISGHFRELVVLGLGDHLQRVLSALGRVILAVDDLLGYSRTIARSDADGLGLRQSVLVGTLGGVSGVNLRLFDHCRWRVCWEFLIINQSIKLPHRLESASLKRRPSTP